MLSFFQYKTLGLKNLKNMKHITHIIMNQFDVYWPQPLSEQACELKADVWLRMPHCNYMCIYVLSGNLFLKLAGLPSLPHVSAGTLLILPAGLYCAVRIPDPVVTITLTI